jgi:hypothetical protein
VISQKPANFTASIKASLLPERGNARIIPAPVRSERLEPRPGKSRHGRIQQRSVRW